MRNMNYLGLWCSNLLHGVQRECWETLPFPSITSKGLFCRNSDFLMSTAVPSWVALVTLEASQFLWEAGRRVHLKRLHYCLQDHWVDPYSRTGLTAPNSGLRSALSLALNCKLKKWWPLCFSKTYPGFANSLSQILRRLNFTFFLSSFESWILLVWVFFRCFYLFGSFFFWIHSVIFLNSLILNELIF